MKLDDHRESDNVDDLRSGAGPGRGGLPLGGGRLGIGTVVVALVASYFLGLNPLTVLNMLSGGGGGAGLGGTAPATAPEVGTAGGQDDPPRQFVSKVLADTEDVWRTIFKQMGGEYQDPRLVLFRGSVPTACGQGQSAMGPFYCPGDHKVYIDLDFYDTLRDRLGAPGDFAQAYVIAHEVGHHVQNLLGISDKLDQARGRVSERQYNALSVKLELQADCFAGVWAHHAQRSRQILEEGDIEEGLNAASKIGDDALQQASRGQVVPESFTHGSSAQRVKWFRRGIETGDIRQCDTFSGQPV